MAKSLRKDRISNGRTAAIEHRSHRAHQNISLLSGLPRRYILGSLLFAILALLPTIWGIYPLPYHLGFVSDAEIRSRVNFHWQDPAAKEMLERIEAQFARRYMQIPRWEWINDISGPVWYVIEEAAKTDDKGGKPAPENLAKYAEKKQVSLSPAQAAILIDTLHESRGQIQPFSHIVAPLQKVLREYVYRRGLLPAERYQAEMGRQIRIVSNDDEIRTTAVGIDSESGPIDPVECGSILDSRLAMEMGNIGIDCRATLREIIQSRLKPSLKFDVDGSRLDLQEKLNDVRRQIQNVLKGDVLLGRGEKVTPVILDKLRTEEQVYRLSLNRLSQSSRLGGKTLLALLLALVCAKLLHAGNSRPQMTGRNASGFATLCLSTLAGSYLLILLGLPATLLPVGILAGLAGLAAGKRNAFILLAGLCGLLIVIREGDAGTALAFFASGSLYFCRVSLIRNKIGLITQAMACGLACAAVVVAWAFMTGEDPVASFLPGQSYSGWQLPLAYLPGRVMGALVGWIISGIAVVILLPLTEKLFRATTNIRLHELQDQDQPCLRQLVIEAPGTFHHSIIVGSLAETAAEAVGANPLLAKVGSYYHDIGKLMKPVYFTENEMGESRHDHLAPTMSALIIIAHVKDGAEMAREYGLPPAIVDIVSQHHGTTIMNFFYHRALKQAVDKADVRDSSFRYSGPIPQFPEAALVMMADAVEAASRSMESPTPAHIRKRVHDILMEKLLDRQMEQSGLTLTDIGKTEDAFVRILTSMFHSRVKYPGQDKEDAKRARRR
jgi:putative nucleotidyltransferase with HDIG domain